MQVQSSTNSAFQSEVFDFIVIGAGVAGTVIASRLHERDPSLSILIIEAGPDSSKTSLAAVTASPAQVMRLKGSELDWNYATVPQPHLDNRSIYTGGGKALGGGSVINFGLWTRGDATDYEVWAKLVGDQRYGYEGFLPYFRKTETCYDVKADANKHGFHGPVHTASNTSAGRHFPLREPIKQAWAAVGVDEIKDINGGSLLGLAEIVEARTEGQRVISSAAYPLKGVRVMTSTLVNRILITSLDDGTKVATGVELADGRKYGAKREVVLSAGSYGTPQILKLSGIGPTEELTRHDITPLVNSPEVGKNLWDHLRSTQMWKLRHPEIGASVGSSKWTDPAFRNGNPMDWWASHSIPQEGLKQALAADEGGMEMAEQHSLFTANRPHLACVVNYVGMPMDGSLVTTYVINHLPTSRGTVTLASRDPAEEPVIDPNHFSTEADRYRIRTGQKMLLKMLGTPAGKEITVGEAVPEGYQPLTLDSSDEEMDVRIRQNAL